VSSSTSSEKSLTTTSSVLGVAEKPGSYFVERIRDRGAEDYIQKRCAKCDRVTQQTSVDIEIYNEYGRAFSVRVVICTECGNSIKQVHQHASLGKPLTDAK
jgi:hypothetical protein